MIPRAGARPQRGRPAATIFTVAAWLWCAVAVAPCGASRAIDEAISLADAGGYDRGVRLLADAVAANPSDDAARLALGRLMAELGRPGDAVETLAPLLEREPASADAVTIAAIGYAAAGRADRLAPLIEEHADAAAAVSAMHHLIAGRPRAALEAAEALTRSAGDQGTLAAIVAAMAERRLGRLDDAEARFARLCEANPHRPFAFELLGRFLRRHRDADRADAALAGLETVSPIYAPITRASLAMRRRDLDHAATLLAEARDRAVAARRPGALDLAQALAAVRFEQRRPAHVAFGPLYRENHLAASSVWHAAQWRERETRRVTDASVWRGVLRMAGEGEAATVEAVAARLLEAGERDAAIAAMWAWIDAHPGDATAHRRLAGWLAEAGAFDRAIDLLDAALDRRPDHAALRLERAALLVKTGDLPAAEAAYRGAMRLDDATRRAAALRLSLLMERLGLPDEAMSVLRDAWRQRDGPTAGDALGLRYAELATASGDLDAAASVWRARLKRDDTNAQAAIGLARVEAAKGRLDRARQRAAHAVEQSPRAAASHLLRLPSSAAADALFDAAEDAVRLDALTVRDADAWLRRRATRAAARGDWPRFERTLAAIADRHGGADWAVALRAAALIHLGSRDAARALVRDAGLAARGRPDPLTLAVGLEARGSRSGGDVAPLLLAMIDGDADRAHTGLRAMPHALTVHRRDMHDMLSAIDVTADATAAAARRLAAARVALEHGVPRLAAALAADVARAHPELTLAHALWAQGLWSADAPLGDALRATRRDAPGGVLMLVLDGLEAMRRGDGGAATAALTAALRREPGNAHLTYQLAEAEAAAGRVTASLRRLSHLRSQPGPYRDQAGRRLVELSVTHRPERLGTVERLVDRMYDGDPPVGVLAAMGRAAVDRGEDGRASRWLVRASLAGAHDAATHLALARLHEARGERRWSLRHLDAAARGATGESAVAEARAMRQRLTQTAGVATE